MRAYRRFQQCAPGLPPRVGEPFWQG
jgi:hypothetical protein